jgi:hypothetical protein
MIEISAGQYKGLAEALNELKKVDKGLLNELRKEMRKKANPYLTSVRSYIQGSEALLRTPGASSGKPAQVFNNQRTGWSQPTVKAYVSSSRYARSIIGIEATGKNGQAGYDIMDKAGLNGYESEQGKALIAMLNRRLKTQKPTRMLYRALMRELPNLTKDVIFVLESYSDRITAKLRN